MLWKKFADEEHIYPKTSTFGIGSIFETYHHRTEASLYLKVVYATTDLSHFSLVQCDSKGKILRTNKKISTRKEIIDFIINNDWRLYKQHFGKREIVPKVKGSLAPKKKNFPKGVAK